MAPVCHYSPGEDIPPGSKCIWVLLRADQSSWISFTAKDWRISKWGDDDYLLLVDTRDVPVAAFAPGTWVAVRDDGV